MMDKELFGFIVIIGMATAIGLVTAQIFLGLARDSYRQHIKTRRKYRIKKKMKALIVRFCAQSALLLIAIVILASMAMGFSRTAYFHVTMQVVGILSLWFISGIIITKVLFRDAA